MNGTLQEALRRATRAARPLALRSAGKDRSNTAIVVHAGRRSGRTYRTPVVAARDQDGFVIALPYGKRTDWAKNVLAKGSASLIAGGQTYEVDRPEVVPLADVSSSFRPKEQRLQKRFRVATALRVHLA
jgi:deazaflavin-dependent oxidoreductase (nitroreductase family)